MQDGDEVVNLDDAAFKSLTSEQRAEAFAKKPVKVTFKRLHEVNY